MKNEKKLSDKEKVTLTELAEKFAESDENLKEALKEQFGEEADNVLAELESGLDEFYKLMGEEYSPETLRKLLEGNMKDMSEKDKYRYLTNITFALTQLCNNVIMGEDWDNLIEANKEFSEYLANNTLTDTAIKKENDLLLANILEQSDAFAVLLIGEPPYEELLESCMTQNSEDIKIMAANTRKFAMNTAAAMYILHTKGELSSLGTQEISPRDMAVMAASALELDAAYKNNSWDKAKAIIQQITRVTVALLVASPMIFKVAEALTGILVLMALLGIFSKVWLVVAALVLAVSAKLIVDQVEEKLDRLLEEVRPVIDATLETIKENCIRFGEWVKANIFPKVLNVWDKISEFVNEHVIKPVLGAANKAKEYIQEVRQENYVQVSSDDYTEEDEEEDEYIVSPC